MRTALIIHFCLILLGVATLPAGYAQSFSITDLGTPDGFTNGTGANSVTHAINAAGAVAGEWGPNANSERAYLYAGNTNTDLGMLPGALYEAAYSVNAANVVVGMAENINGYFYAFAYTNGALVNLSVLGPAGYTYSLARAINNNSMIVGESYTSSLLNSPIHAVIFLGSQQVTDLGTLTNGTYSAAYGINNSNVIVGESTVSSGDTYAFVYSNNVMVAVGTLGGNYSAAFAINDSGQIVGEASTAGGETHACLFKNGVMTDLGTLGGTASSASAINAAGHVVGYATTAAGDSHAFLYNGSAMMDLNNLISSAVCTNLTSADGINDAGQIAATGYTPTGELRAFLLTPAFNLTSPLMLSNQQFQLTIQGVPGQKFVLAGSTNLLNWDSLWTNTLVATATNWVDTGAPIRPDCFYRAQEIP